MPDIIQDLEAFRARKQAQAAHARQLAAFQLVCGIDLEQALKAGPAEVEAVIRRIGRQIERERLKGLRRHWSYDLNRHIALKQGLDLLRRLHRDGEGEVLPCPQTKRGARRRRDSR